MNVLLNQMIEYLERHDWYYSVSEKRPIIRTAFQGEIGRWEILILGREEPQGLTYFSLFPSVVPSNRRHAVAELFTRLNYLTDFCCLQINFDDGDVRLATRISAPPTELSEDQIVELLFGNIDAMERYYDSIMKVIHGNVPPIRLMPSLKSPDHKPEAHRRFDRN